MVVFKDLEVGYVSTISKENSISRQTFYFYLRILSSTNIWCTRSGSRQLLPSVTGLKVTQKRMGVLRSTFESH